MTIDEIYADAPIKPRPVWRRALMRMNAEPLDAPTEDEKQDAIRLLAEPWADAAGREAFRILDEYGQ